MRSGKDRENGWSDASNTEVIMGDSSIEKLTDEIIESQKIRSDYMKWKILAIAALGATAFGLKGETLTTNIKYVILAMAPFICFYIDTLCYHVSLRIAGIGRFFETFDRNNNNPIIKYERFIRHQTPAYVRWEHIDAAGSSIAVSLFVVCYAVFVWNNPNAIIAKMKAGIFLGIAGVLGLGLCAIAYFKYSNERKRINSLGNTCYWCIHYYYSSDANKDRKCKLNVDQIAKFCTYFKGNSFFYRLRKEFGNFFPKFKAKQDSCSKCINFKKTKNGIFPECAMCIAEADKCCASFFRNNESSVYSRNE